MRFARPINHRNPRVTQSYSSSHPGFDYGYPNGTPIYASQSGKVTIANNSETRQWIANTANDPFRIAGKRRALRTADYGNMIKLEHADNYKTLYAHLKKDSLLVRLGDQVKKGQKIAEVGSTGNSSGNHLHWELRRYETPVSPSDLLDRDFTDYQAGEVIDVGEKTMTIDTELFEELVGKASKYDAFFDGGYSDIRVVSRRINELQRELDNAVESKRRLEKEHEKCADQVIEIPVDPGDTTTTPEVPGVGAPLVLADVSTGTLIDELLARFFGRFSRGEK